MDEKILGYRGIKLKIDGFDYNKYKGQKMKGSPNQGEKNERFSKSYTAATSSGSQGH